MDQIKHSKKSQNFMVSILKKKFNYQEKKNDVLHAKYVLDVQCKTMWDLQANVHKDFSKLNCT